MKKGRSSRRPDMTYESCCAKISVVVHSSSTRRRPSSPKALESPRVSKLTSSSSTCFGSSSSSWDICVLPVSRPSRVCVVNTSTRSLWILWTFTGSILTLTHSETLRGGWKEKIQKMSRATWLRLQVWKQRQWCWVKVLYFHTWTQFNLQFSLILYTLY